MKKAPGFSEAALCAPRGSRDANPGRRICGDVNLYTLVQTETQAQFALIRHVSVRVETIVHILREERRRTLQVVISLGGI